MSVIDEVRARLSRAAGLSRPRPPVGLATGRTVPAVALRLVSGAILLIAVAAATPVVSIWVVVGALVVATLLWPKAVWGPVALAPLSVALLFGPPDPARTALVLFAAHLAVTIAALLGSLTAAARVEVRVLRRPGIRFLILQVFAQGMALAGAWLVTQSITLGIVTAVAAVALAVVVWVISSRVRVLRD
jgi:hypothetical protein